MLDETITVNEQYDAALDTIIKLQAELAEFKRIEEDGPIATIVRLMAELKEEKQLEWEAMGHAARWEEQVEQFTGRVKTLEGALTAARKRISEVRIRVAVQQLESAMSVLGLAAVEIEQALAAKEPK